MMQWLGHVFEVGYYDHEGVWHTIWYRRCGQMDNVPSGERIYARITGVNGPHLEARIDRGTAEYICM